MARSMSPEREKEYEELSGYLDFFATHVMGVDPASPVHPTATLKRIAEEYGRSKALEGLRQAANDTVQSLDSKPGVAQALDAALRGNGLVGFYEIARRYSYAFRGSSSEARSRTRRSAILSAARSQTARVAKGKLL